MKQLEAKRGSEDDALVTKGYLRVEFKKVNTKINTLRDEMHAIEYRLDNKIDTRFNEIKEEMRKQTDIFQKLADQVIGVHKNFETEAVSIKNNYDQLEGRVKKLEEHVFPA